MSKKPVIPVLLADRAFDSSYLPLGMIFAYAKAHNNAVLLEHFDFFPVRSKLVKETDFYYQLAQENPGSIWAVPCYVWNFALNLEVAKTIKEIDPTAIIIVGGPHVPKYLQESKDYLFDHPFLDIAIRGEGELTFACTLEALIHGMDDLRLHSVEGISYISNGEFVRTEDRPRINDLDILPSPYLTGEFDYPEYEDAAILTIETNRGCPFGCTFCDWGSATLQKIKPFEINRVYQEIQMVSDKRAKSLIIADANYGVFPRDVDITQKIADCRNTNGFPGAFSTNYVKNAGPRVADIIRILRTNKLETSGILSMQSTDPETLSAIDRSNIKTSKYEQLLAIFKENNLKLSSDLMIGLPEQTYDSYKNDLQFFVDRKIITVTHRSMLLPNSPMNDPDYKKKYQIETDEEAFVISTSSANTEQIEKMSLLYLCFQVFYLLGVCKYLIYYVQVESKGKIQFIDVLSRMIDKAFTCSKYPINQRFIQLLESNSKKQINAHKLLVEWHTEQVKFVFEDLDAFYQEWVNFFHTEYQFDFLPNVKDTLIAAQKAVMPKLGKTTPFEQQLPHNLVSYFKQIKDILALNEESYKTVIPLQNYPPASITCRTLKAKTFDNLNLKFRDLHNNAGWELRSPLRFY